jgi:HEXXH motif-containing protein
MISPDAPEAASEEAALDLDGFACAELPLDNALADAIVIEHATEYLRLFLEIFGGRLERTAAGTAAVLGSALEAGLSFDAAWDESFGRVQLAVHDHVAGREVDVEAVAAASCLHLHTCGIEGAWVAQMPSPVAFRICDAALSPTESLAVHARGDDILVETRDSHASTALVRGADGCWRAQAGSAGRVRLGVRDVIVGADEDAGAATDRLVPAVEACRRAVALMERHAPGFLPWVEKVIRRVIALDGSDGVLRSFSDQDRPGTIGASLPASALSIGETLVHEASHQMANIVKRLGPLDDGSDDRGYFSPVKQTERPIGAILIAYHAFANVVLFYRACLASGVEDVAHCRRNEERHVRELGILLGHLRASPALTDLGRGLVDPLARRV